MARFVTTVAQHPWVPDDGVDAHAVVTVRCEEAGIPGRTGDGDAAEVIVVDTSEAMGESALAGVRLALIQALTEVVDGTWFAVVAGDDPARVVFPPMPADALSMPGVAPSMVRMDARSRERAADALSSLRVQGGTAIGAWLDLTGRLFGAVPGLVHRHALLVVGGVDPDQRALDAAVGSATGRFRCDCLGIGTGWQVSQVRDVALALQGSVDLVLGGDQLAAAVRSSMRRGVPAADLHVWLPEDAQVVSLRQVAPDVVDLTDLGWQAGPRVTAFATGAWSDESRGYHLAVRLPQPRPGQDVLAARVRLVVGDEVVTEALVKAAWTPPDVS